MGPRVPPLTAAALLLCALVAGASSATSPTSRPSSVSSSKPSSGSGGGSGTAGRALLQDDVTSRCSLSMTGRGASLDGRSRAAAAIACSGPPGHVRVGMSAGSPLTLAAHRGVKLDPSCGQQGACLLSLCSERGGGTVLLAAPNITRVRLRGEDAWVKGVLPLSLLCLHGNMHLDAATITDNELAVDMIDADVGSAVKACEGSHVTVTRSLLARNVNSGTGNGAGGALYVDSNATMELRGCELRDNRVSRPGSEYSGGAVFAWQAMLIVLNSSFTNNSASDAGGGAIETDNSVLELRGCSFRGNSVGRQLRELRLLSNYVQGGAVYFWVGPVGSLPVPNDTSLVISNCSFTDNHSWKDGGALSIYAPNVIITDSTFRGNRANNAGGAIEMLSERAEAPLGRLVMRGCLLDNNSASTGGALSLRSDGDIGSLSVTIAGSRLVNNSAVRSNGGAISFDAAGNLTLDSTAFDNNTASPSGADVSARHKAWLIFSGTPALSPSSSTVVWPRSDGGCVRGEVLPPRGVCTVCPAATFSLVPTDDECEPCPQNANCVRGDNITPNTGFWQSRPNGPQVHRCPLTAACQAGGACADGFTGPLCGVCADGYGSTTPFRCRHCLSNQATLLLFAAAGVGSFALVAAISHLTWRDNKDCHAVDVLQPSDVVKVLLLFLQYFLLLGPLVQWPASVLALLRVLTGVFTSANGQAVSLDCLLAASGIESRLPRAVAKQLVALLVPLALLVTLLALHAALYGLSRARAPCLRGTGQLHRGGTATRLLVAVLVAVFFCFPSLVSSSLAWFACLPIDSPVGLHPAFATLTAPHGWWMLDVRQRCYEGWHARWALGLGVPCALAFCVVLPACLFLLLRAHLASVSAFWFRARFGFLVRTYRREAPWYEAVVASQTVALSAVCVFRYELGTLNALLLVSCLLALSAGLQLALRPHKFARLARLQLGATACLYFTACAGMGLSAWEGGVRGTAPLHPEALASCVIVAVAVFVLWGLAELVRESRRALRALHACRTSTTAWLCGKEPSPRLARKAAAARALEEVAAGKSGPPAPRAGGKDTQHAEP